MKFSLVAILPAVLWTVFRFLSYEAGGSSQVGTADAVSIAAVWFLTAAVLTLYWAARIVRFALRGPQR